MRARSRRCFFPTDAPLGTFPEKTSCLRIYNFIGFFLLTLSSRYLSLGLPWFLHFHLLRFFFLSTDIYIYIIQRSLTIFPDFSDNYFKRFFLTRFGLRDDRLRDNTFNVSIYRFAFVNRAVSSLVSPRFDTINYFGAIATMSNKWTLRVRFLSVDSYRDLYRKLTVRSGQTRENAQRGFCFLSRMREIRSR